MYFWSAVKGFLIYRKKYILLNNYRRKWVRGRINIQILGIEESKITIPFFF